MAPKQQKQTTGNRVQPARSWRYLTVLGGVMVVAVALCVRLVELHVLDREFLRAQGEQRTVRTEPIDANRGVITDRHGESLAVSTPVQTLWMNPQELDPEHEKLGKLAQILDLDVGRLQARLKSRQQKQFLYLRRKVQPSLASRVLELGIPGVHSRREYRRYYPAGEVAAHVVGLTNIDEVGQEGLELSFNHWLSGEEGRKRVLRDNRGRNIRDISLVRDARPGNDLQLSLDLRLQYLAYRELKAVVQAHDARGGTLVMLDASNGEVLAMVNQPSFNPNDRSQRDPVALRNRAITDLFEPGSTIKPLTAAIALESGDYTPETRIDTSPGFMRMGGFTIRDNRNYGELDLTEVVARSSNVGISKVAMELSGNALQDFFYRAGFGQSTGIGFPGEAVGVLPTHATWRPVEVAALSYGYGMSVNALQLAQSYMAIANGGVRYPVTLLRTDKPARGTRVMSEEVAAKVREMLLAVVEEGTGSRARAALYSVGGKTGTIHLVGARGYERDQYKALFAGMGPAENPRIVTVVAVDAPSSTEYYGGEVAAPVFGRVMSDALRLLNVRPEMEPELVDDDAGRASGGQG